MYMNSHCVIHKIAPVKWQSISVEPMLKPEKKWKTEQPQPRMLMLQFNANWHRQFGYGWKLIFDWTRNMNNINAIFSSFQWKPIFNKSIDRHSFSNYRNVCFTETNTLNYMQNKLPMVNFYGIIFSWTLAYFQWI